MCEILRDLVIGISSSLDARRLHDLLALLSATLEKFAGIMINLGVLRIRHSFTKSAG